MKDRNFWFKPILTLLILVVFCAVGASWTAGRFYAQQSNSRGLEQLAAEAKTYNSKVSENLRYLISDMIARQTKKSFSSSSFSLLAVIDSDSREITHVQPQAYADRVKKLKAIPYKKLKHFPVSFYPLKLSWKKQTHTALLVDVDKINSVELPPSIKKGKILMGVLSSKGMIMLSRLFNNKNLAEMFVLDRETNQFLFHSRTQYTGQVLPKNSSFSNLKKVHPAGWSVLLENEGVLSVGARMAMMDSYLTINKKAVRANQYFFSFFEKIFPVLMLIGILMFIPLYFFIQPKSAAYQYLARWIHRYAMWNSFSAPDYKGRNIYLNDIQPILKKIFWKFREEKLFHSRENPRDNELFSEMMKATAKKIESQYSNIKIHFQPDGDIEIPSKSNWLEQAVLEILKNAAESMNFNGSISVHAFKEGSMFYCTIRDYGPGMSESLMKKACDAYFTSKSDRAGLGLTLAQSALARLGGRLYFANAKDDDKGLMVQLSLPEDLASTRWAESKVQSFS